MRKTTIGLTFLVAWLLAVPTVWAQKDEAKEHAELAKAMKDAKVSLEKGLSVSTHEGKPISAKYEMEDGKLQLSVYAMKGDKFSEVIVDHTTGQVAKAEPITGGDDLTHAKAQSEAMAKATRSLNAAIADAVKVNKGFRAVSVMPTVKDGHPIAGISLVKGTEWKSVSAKLD